MANRRWGMHSGKGTFNEVEIEKTLTVNGDFTFGDASTDTLTVTGKLDANGNVDLGSGDDTINVGSGSGDTVALKEDTRLDTTKKIEFRDAGLFINSPADGKLEIEADGGGADDILLDGSVQVDAGHDIAAVAGAGSIDWSSATGSWDSPTGAVTFNGNATVATGSTLDTADADGLLSNGEIVPVELPMTYGPILNADIADHSIFIADKAYEVVGIEEVHTTAESAGTVNIQIEKLTGTTAPGSGTDLLTNNTNAGFDGTATANTVQSGTLTGTTADLQLASGDRLGVDFTGDVPGELDGVTVTVYLKRI